MTSIILYTRKGLVYEIKEIWRSLNLYYYLHLITSILNRILSVPYSNKVTLYCSSCDKFLNLFCHAEPHYINKL